MVFGHTLVDAQLYLLQFIPPGGRLLIAGGGTGWILEEIAERLPGSLEIDYIEVSARMMAAARKRKTGAHKVTYLTMPVQHMPTAMQYDAVMTAFLFDNFSDSTAREVFTAMHARLKNDGLWLYCDFLHTGGLVHKILLKSMFLFFRMFRSIESRRLPDMDARFLESGYRVAQQKKYMNGFVAATAYIK